MATANAMFTITDVGDLNGRNLIQRSFFTKEPWTGPKNVVSDGFGVYHDKECLPVYTSYIRENTNDGTETAYPDLVFEENTQYTISGKWAQFRTDSKFNVLWIVFRYSDGTSTIIKQPSVNNEWRDFKLTSEAGKTVVAITHTYLNAGYTFLADYKLEVGTEATEWTPAPEDVNAAYLDAKTANETADYAKTEIDGLEVGGRNLISHGDEEHVKTFNANGICPNYFYTTFGRPYAHEEGRILTVSCDYTVTGNESETAEIYARCNGYTTVMDGVNNIVNVHDFPSGHYVHTFKVTASQAAVSAGTSHLYFRYMTSGSVLSVKNMKVEIGNRATDWTPAPEDVEEAINSKNSVYYQATAPTGTLKDGDTWFDTDNHYKISRWNVAEQNWIAAPLGDQAIGNLNASHINAGTLTAVDIEAGKAQDIAGTIKVYDENDAVKVSLDKDGLMATKGKIGGWNITSNSIEYDDGTAPTDSTVISTDPDTGEELIEEGQPGLVGGRTILKLCTYDSSYPDAGPQLISATYNSSNVAEDSTLRIGSGGLSCYYNRNNGVTGGSLSLSPKLINVINADYDEDQVLWTDSANLNPGSLTIIMSTTENGEQTAMGRSFLTHSDLSFIGDGSNPQLASGIAHWSILSPERTVKDTLKVTVYHCGNLFWAHFTGTIPAGWTASNTQNVFVPIITGDTGLSNSAFAAPPDNLTKYIIPTDLTNMRISVIVRSDGQLGISRIAEPFKGNATTTIAGYMETCDIFWAHIG